MMFCRRPGTPTSSRVVSAVGLLLTLSSFLGWGTAFASSAESKSASGFVKDAAVSPAAKAEIPTALAPGIHLRRAEENAEEGADSSLWRGRRSLQGAYIAPYFVNDTTSAPLSVGNTNTECGGLSDCINGCRSHFYKATGVTTAGYLGAGTCGTVDFAQRLYIWKGSNSDCSTLTCTGTYASSLVFRCGSVGAFGASSLSLTQRCRALDAQPPIRWAARAPLPSRQMPPAQMLFGSRNLEQSTTFRWWETVLATLVRTCLPSEATTLTSSWSLTTSVCTPQVLKADELLRK
jgi:hypothetical protein